MTKALIASVMAALWCSGCYRANAREVVMPSGQRGYAITCDREVDCYEKAGEACAHGYEVVKRSTSQDAYMSWSGWESNFMVQCK
jgi:hypothetical protein